MPSPSCHTVICCTASRRVIGAEMTENGYIQGAGDDSEGWSNGLTPNLFWDHTEQLLAAAEEDMGDLVQDLTTKNQDHDAASSDAVRIGPTMLYIGTLPRAAQAEQYDGIVICGGTVPSSPIENCKDQKGTKFLHLSCGDGKLGSRALRSQLPLIPQFIASLPNSSSPPKILFACPNGKDLSVGIALAVLCLFFDDDSKSTGCISLRPFYAQLLSSLMS